LNSKRLISQRNSKIKEELVQMTSILQTKVPLEVIDGIMALAWGDFEATFPTNFQEKMNNSEESLRSNTLCRAFTRARNYLFEVKGKPI